MPKIKVLILFQLAAMVFTSLLTSAPQKALAQGKDLELTIVYDNNPYDDRLETRTS